MRKLSFSFAVVLLAAVPMSGGKPRPAANWTTTATAWDSGDYKYDGAGNIIQIGSDVYTYDALGRLTYATANSPNSAEAVQRFKYDSYGNLEKVTTTSGGTDFVERFRVKAETNQLNGTDCDVPYDICFMGEYDGAGRQTGIIPDEKRYEWTPLGEMKGVNLSTRRERYIYDANGERIITIDLDTGGRLFTLRNGANQVVREIRKDSSAEWMWSRDYVYRGDKLLAEFVAGEVGAGPHRHYHPDHLGTPRLVTDTAGYKRTIHAYWPFGKEAPGNERDTSERMKFTGHERDSSRDASATGHDLDYMHARLYTPAMGRFLSVDPGTESIRLEMPQSWNRYAYVMNNPIKYVDPTGRVFSCFELKDDKGEPYQVCTDVIDATAKDPGPGAGPKSVQTITPINDALEGHIQDLKYLSWSDVPMLRTKEAVPCKNYWQRVLDAEAASHGLAGTAAKFRSGMLTAEKTAEAARGISAMQWAKTGFDGAKLGAAEYTAAETGVIAGASTATNALFVTAAWEGGVGVGSMTFAAATDGCDGW